MYYTTAHLPQSYSHANHSLYSNVRTWQNVDDPTSNSNQSDDQDSDDDNRAAGRQVDHKDITDMHAYMGTR